jgi:hypothetical protein
LQAYNTRKSGGFGSVAEGLGDYYFGNFMRITRRVKNSKYYQLGPRLLGMIAYNTFAGTLMNMSAQPARATLGFDLPVIGLLSINTGFGVTYKDPTSLSD